MIKVIKKYFRKKSNWQKTLLLFILFFALFSAGYALAQDFGVDPLADGLGGSLGEAGKDPRELAGRIINFSLGFLGLIAVCIVIFAGFKWMTSGGDETKISDAKKLLRAGLIGLVIILSSWGIATFLIRRFSDVVDGTQNTIYNDGDTSSCGCGGYMVYRNGSWGSCIGGYCGDGFNGPTSCDGNSLLPGCQALDQICAEGSYCDDNCICRPKGQAGDSCNLNSAGGTCSASDNLCGKYLKCDPNSCVCLGSPVITGISPIGGFCENDQNRSCRTNLDCGGGICNSTSANGASGNFITIVGKNFGKYVPGQSKVIFLGSGSPKQALNPSEINPSCVNFWQDDQIVVAIPNGVKTGAIKVVSGDLEDSTNDDYGPKIPDFRANNIVRPGLCEIDPVRGLLSSDVSYQGINLYAGNAYFGNYNSNVPGLVSNFNDIQGLSGQAKIPNIRSGESGSFVLSSLNGNLERSNFLSFVKDREPGEGAFISSFSPLSGNVGQYVTIFGSGFGANRLNKKVFFGDVEAVYDFPDACLKSVWQNNQIIVKVPAGLENGNFNISIHLEDKVINTSSINPNTFSFDKNLSLKTSLCKIDPVRGPANTDVSLWGEYFGAKDSEVSVKFNATSKNISAKVQKRSRADYLSVKVPEDAITGPVRVLRSGDYGNELNFSVGACSVNEDCGLQVCCPANTFKKGQCVNSLDQCFVEVPYSVYEWSFNTAFSSSESDSNESCAGIASSYGACLTNSCPNVPGVCSPYPGGQKLFSKNCSRDCSLVKGCKIGENSCYYDENYDFCFQSLDLGKDYNCSLDKTIEFEFDGRKVSRNAYCNKDGHWEMIFTASCPEGFSKGLGDKCIDLNSTCSICEFGLSCRDFSGTGRCVSEKICPSGSVCDSVSGSPSGEYKCSSIQSASCDCCCTIGQSARDCCSYKSKDGQIVQLECLGVCGSDLIDDGFGMGRCGGCSLAGETTFERDLACNCTNHSGQYCEINDDRFPNGFCTDCSSLSRESCLEHSNFCCLDSKGTLDPSDDVCRGGDGTLISNDPSNENFGYCAYYNCSETQLSVCATSYPVKIGTYAKLIDCEKSCAETDPCSSITNFNDCSKEISGRCCFDYKNNVCELGKAIKDNSSDAGYCAYYNCSDSNTCLANNPIKDGSYKNLSDCDKYCNTPPHGVGLSCSNSRSNDCDVSVCNAPGFACLNSSGNFGSMPDCGVCCCQPVSSPGAFDACKSVNNNLSCIADRGSCKGDDRGLCCGCSNDSQCGSSEFIGCGIDTCCHSRPNIKSSSPKHLESDVCRNAILQIEFDQLMNFGSLENNLILIEEKDPNTGSCSFGSLLADNNLIENKSSNFFARLKFKVNNSWQKIASTFFNSYAQRALASRPSNDKLYCLVPGSIYLENSLDSSKINFISNEALLPSTNYYLLIKGDEDLNSQTGVVNINGVGFNGKGYFDPFASSEGSYIEGENIMFNGRAFKNSHIIKFSTLSSQGSMSGACMVDSVKISPSSYLFKTTENALPSEENDSPAFANFDTKADRDKVFTAFALSSSKQAIRPIKGYSWDYKFKILNDSIVSGKTLPGLALNQFFVSANPDIVDGETKIKAEIDMSRFSGDVCNDSATCFCSSLACPENCCNLSLGGDGFSDNADVFVFVCNNPWPNIKADGTWAPWYDTADNCNIDEGSCGNFNFKFYYCRDSKDSNKVNNDLPAILNQPLVSGQKSSLVCSSDRSISCSSTGERCGVDADNDGRLDGVCIWGVLKESFFFREELPSSGEILSAVDLKTGGAIELKWRSGSDQAESYKVYYFKSGSRDLSVNEYKASDVCQLDNKIYNCSATISSLSNNVPYIFRVGVVSSNKAESSPANEKTAIASDKLPPKTPTGLKAVINESSLVNISWNRNQDDTSFYRLYRGLIPGVYGESYDSGVKTNSISFLPNELSTGNNYFAVSAIDFAGNESQKSVEILLNIPKNILE